MINKKHNTKAQSSEAKEINRIWNQIKKGNCKEYSEEEFFKAMKKWHK